LYVDPEGAGDPKPPPSLDRVLEQGGVADARVAMQDEDAALPAAHAVQQPVEHLKLAVPAEQLLARQRRDHRDR
jgi:hypothetical protein